MLVNLKMLLQFLKTVGLMLKMVKNSMISSLSTAGSAMAIMKFMFVMPMVVYLVQSKFWFCSQPNWVLPLLLLQLAV